MNLDICVSQKSLTSTPAIWIGTDPIRFKSSNFEDRRPFSWAPGQQIFDIAPLRKTDVSRTRVPLEVLVSAVSKTEFKAEVQLICLVY